MAAPTADVVMASSRQDAEALEAIVRHHAELAAALHAHVEDLLAATMGSPAGTAAARDAAVRFCGERLAPHAQAEEDSLYPAAAGLPGARLLVDAMTAEHRVIYRLVDEIRDQADPARVAASAYALRVLLGSHLDKENEQLLPLVAADPALSLADLVEGMHELLGGHEHGVDGGGCGGAGDACGCGGTDTAVPELDVRSVPHAIRHATVLGAFDAVPSGGSLVLVAPHDPLPLLRQLEERAGAALSVTYLQRGPQAWRLQLARG